MYEKTQKKFLCIFHRFCRLRLAAPRVRVNCERHTPPKNEVTFLIFGCFLPHFPMCATYAHENKQKQKNKGFECFMRFIFQEMNVENLLFIIEVAQFKAVIAKYYKDIDNSTRFISFQTHPRNVHNLVVHCLPGSPHNELPPLTSSAGGRRHHNIMKSSSTPFFPSSSPRQVKVASSSFNDALMMKEEEKKKQLDVPKLGLKDQVRRHSTPDLIPGLPEHTPRGNSLSFILRGGCAVY